MNEEELIWCARRFSLSVSKKYPGTANDLESAALEGVAVALSSPSMPSDPEGRRKYTGQAIWNMIRRELDRLRRARREVPLNHDVAAPSPSIDWADLVSTIDDPVTVAVFEGTYGPMQLKSREMAEEIGLTFGSLPCRRRRGLEAARRYLAG